ncbi:MAG: hypothetical protein QT00_C0002G0350 [archaeon GW2011_AR5]|nr:MAG: hypothetical protein QT00_C0002G0350 [archaeon GW2011_AR5]
MELTITEVVFIMIGLLGLGISLLIYIHFNGGIQNNIDLLLGVLR